MKRLALVNLIGLTAVKSVSACDTPPGVKLYNVFEGREIFFWTIFIGAYVLFVPIVVFYFLRKRRGISAILCSALSLILFIPAIFLVGIFSGTCSDGTFTAAVIIGEFFFMFLLFTIQLSSWISERKTKLKLR